MLKTLPNILTIFRIAIIPVIVGMFYLESTQATHLILASLFAFAGFTDFLDGYLARKYELQSRLGRFLDPIADKLLVASVVVMLVHFGKADIFPALAIICREILVSGLREYLAELNVSVPVSNLSKYKTAIQMTAITMLLLGSEGLGIDRIYDYDVIVTLGSIALWIAALLTLITGYAYLKAGMKHIV